MLTNAQIQEVLLLVEAWLPDWKTLHDQWPKFFQTESCDLLLHRVVRYNSGRSGKYYQYN
eukprot:UN00123